MKRYLLWIVVLLLLVGSAGMVTWLCGEDPINWPAYEQIRLGMTLEQVRGILGRPGLDFQIEGEGLAREICRTSEEGAWDPKPGDNEPGTRWAWPGEDAYIAVRVDRDNRVTDKMFIELSSLGLVDRIRWRTNKLLDLIWKER